MPEFREELTVILTPKYPHLLHGGDYNPDQWLDRPDILEEDLRLMKEAHINCVSVGIFAWSKLEPEEGRYEFDWLEEILDRLFAQGITAVLATPSGAKPVWMSEKYPEIRRVGPDLHRDETGQRHNHCYTSPLYREKVQAIDRALAQRFGCHPGVILWHLSNEYGGMCYCPQCQAAFRRWLREKYGTLDRLNHSWWTGFWSHTYTDWDQIHAPVPRGEMSIHGLNLDWKRFVTDQVCDFMKLERDAVKSGNPDIPVTTNFMYDFPDYNYFKFKDLLDVISWDSYPQWRNGDNTQVAMDFALEHDRMRSLKRQPFLLMESTPSYTNWTSVSKMKKPGLHLASSMQAVAHGSNSVQYFQFRKSRGSFEKFHGAVVDHYGKSDTRVFRDVAQVGRRLEELDGLYQSQAHPQVALVLDTENRWALENAAGPRNCGIHYWEQVKSHYKALWERGIPVDIVDQECSLEGYRLVIAPMLYLLRAGFGKKLRDFVEQGGTLVGTYHTGLVDENDLCFLGGWPGDGLMEVFGLWHEDTDALWDGEQNSLVLEGGKSYVLRDLCALIHPRGAQVLGTYGEDFYQGEPALTVNRFGKGKAYYLAAPSEEGFYRDFYRNLEKELELGRALPVDLPHGVEACLREDDSRDYVFLQNFSGEARKISLPEGYTLWGEENPVQEIQLAPYDSLVLVRQKKTDR